jgi:hypothetical protein
MNFKHTAAEPSGPAAFYLTALRFGWYAGASSVLYIETAITRGGQQ